jgi:hypothetical protein
VWWWWEKDGRRGSGEGDLALTSRACCPGQLPHHTQQEGAGERKGVQRKAMQGNQWHSCCWHRTPRLPIRVSLLLQRLPQHHSTDKLLRALDPPQAQIVRCIRTLKAADCVLHRHQLHPPTNNRPPLTGFACITAAARVYKEENRHYTHFHGIKIRNAAPVLHRPGVGTKTADTRLRRNTQKKMRSSGHEKKQSRGI